MAQWQFILKQIKAHAYQKWFRSFVLSHRQVTQHLLNFRNLLQIVPLWPT